MRGYVKKALKELKHIFTAKHHCAPSKIEQPNYGAKKQYVKEDNAPPLSAIQIKQIESMVRKVLYYGHAIDNTMLHALNNIVSTKRHT